MMRLGKVLYLHWCVYLCVVLHRKSELVKTMHVVDIQGGVRKYGYYYVDIFVGSTQPQRQSVILDTGSNLLAFTCSICADRCGDHIDPQFDMTKSPSLQALTCTNLFCSHTCDPREDPRSTVASKTTPYKHTSLYKDANHLYDVSSYPTGQLLGSETSRPPSIQPAGLQIDSAISRTGFLTKDKGDPFHSPDSSHGNKTEDLRFNLSETNDRRAKKMAYADMYDYIYGDIFHSFLYKKQERKSNSKYCPYRVAFEEGSTFEGLLFTDFVVLAGLGKGLDEMPPEEENSGANRRGTEAEMLIAPSASSTGKIESDKIPARPEVEHLKKRRRVGQAAQPPRKGLQNVEWPAKWPWKYMIPSELQKVGLPTNVEEAPNIIRQGVKKFHRNFVSNPGISEQPGKDVLRHLSTKRKKTVIGCHNKETKYFKTQKVSGILGLGYPDDEFIFPNVIFSFLDMFDPPDKDLMFSTGHSAPDISKLVHRRVSAENIHTLNETRRSNEHATAQMQSSSAGLGVSQTLEAESQRDVKVSQRKSSSGGPPPVVDKEADLVISSDSGGVKKMKSNSLYQDKRDVVEHANLFAICLARRGGELTVGGYRTVRNSKSAKKQLGGFGGQELNEGFGADMSQPSEKKEYQFVQREDKKGKNALWTDIVRKDYYGVVVDDIIIKGQSVLEGLRKKWRFSEQHNSENSIWQPYTSVAMLDSGSTHSYVPSRLWPSLVEALAPKCEGCVLEHQDRLCWKGESQFGEDKLQRINSTDEATRHEPNQSAQTLEEKMKIPDMYIHFRPTAPSNSPNLSSRFSNNAGNLKIDEAHQAPHAIPTDAANNASHVTDIDEELVRMFRYDAKFATSKQNAKDTPDTPRYKGAQDFGPSVQTDLQGAQAGKPSTLTTSTESLSPSSSSSSSSFPSEEEEVEGHEQGLLVKDRNLTAQSAQTVQVDMRRQHTSAPHHTKHKQVRNTRSLNSEKISLERDDNEEDEQKPDWSRRGEKERREMDKPSNNSIRWKRSHFVYKDRNKVDGQNVYCLSVEPSQDAEKLILGMNFFLNKNILFDIENAKVGIIPTRCPTKTKRATIDLLRRENPEYREKERKNDQLDRAYFGQPKTILPPKDRKRINYPTDQKTHEKFVVSKEQPHSSTKSEKASDNKENVQEELKFNPSRLSFEGFKYTDKFYTQALFHYCWIVLMLVCLLKHLGNKLEGSQEYPRRALVTAEEPSPNWESRSLPTCDCAN